MHFSLCSEGCHMFHLHKSLCNYAVGGIAAENGQSSFYYSRLLTCSFK